ncbi:MAG TPA: peptide chain release factor N(5)-glutamine methyltransferase [Candidatus Omnitrophica bacterium]|nr:peptide chain release factor N(5)-glutamine methyltransferase [Candidatus Omnitrophota bacterium]
MLSCETRIEKLVSNYTKELKGVSQSARAEIEEMILTIKSLNNRSALYMHSQTLAPHEISILNEMIAIRRKGIPLQYILGKVYFYGLEFKISPGVFIPRPETELMIDYVIKEYSGCNNLNILEIGTGSGVISICLTKFLATSKIIATDISRKALELARHNAKLHKVKIDFIQANLFDFLSPRAKFDLIISNPPYVGSDEYKFLAPEVKLEPRKALIGGKYGYEFTLQLVSEAVAYIKEQGKVIVEIDYRAKDVYIARLGNKFKLKFLPDFNLKQRVMVVEKNYG